MSLHIILTFSLFCFWTINSCVCMVTVAIFVVYGHQHHVFTVINFFLIFFSYKRYSARLFLHKASLYACVLLRLRLLCLIFCCCFRAWQTRVPPWMVEPAALQSLKTDSPGPVLMLCTVLWDPPEKFRAKVRYFGNDLLKLLLAASQFYVFLLSLVFSRIPCPRRYSTHFRSMTKLSPPGLTVKSACK